MVAITSAVLGAASLGFGAYQYFDGRGQQEDALAAQQQGYQMQRQGAELMYSLEKDKSQTSRDFAALEYGANRAAADFSRNVANRSSEINRGIIDTQFDIEKQRKTAMELDARRQQTEIIRNQQRARALSLTTATAQGAARSTGLQGSYAQFSGQSNVNALGVQQQLDLGRNVFNLNAQLAGQRKDMVNLENVYAQARADQQTNRADMLYNYAQINADYQTRAAGIQTNYMSQGQGMINQGQGMYAAGQSQQGFGASLMQLGMNLPGYGQTAGNIFNNFVATPSGYTGGMGLGFGSMSNTTGRLY